MKTEYRGHTISYSENSDEWWCSDINYSNISMAKVKAKIDAMYLKLRKESAVPCYEINSHGGRSELLTESTVIEYIKGIYRGDTWTGKPVTLVNHMVAVVAQRQGSTRAARREIELSRLAPATPETRAAADLVRQRHDEYLAAMKAYEAAVEAIPRLTIEDVDALVRVHKSEAEVGKDTAQ